jgi:quercetin dioxygenase-like cupin family protein
LKFGSTRTVRRLKRQTRIGAGGAPLAGRQLWFILGTGELIGFAIKGSLAMKHALATTWILTGCLTGAFASDPTSVQHPGAQATPSPEVSAQSQTGLANAVVELENDAVVVVRIRIAPHERTPMHDIASARLVVWLTDAHLRDTHPDGRSAEIRRRAGDIDWVPVQRHAGENLSHEPLEFLAIVPKNAGTAAAR